MQGSVRANVARLVRRLEMQPQTASAGTVAAHVDALDWVAIAEDLNEYGNAVLPSLLTASECEALARMYQDDHLFRSRVVMGHHGFGQGEKSLRF